MKKKITKCGRAAASLLLILTLLCCFSGCDGGKSPDAGKYTDCVAQGDIDAICGEMKWTLDVDGTLTISGTGDMPNYSFRNTPWFSIAPMITKIVVEEGVTGIGAWAFHMCEQMESISLPSSLRTIGTFAIRDCITLKSITIPAGVVELGDNFIIGDVSLEKIEVEYGNKYYRSQNNCLINNEGIIINGCKTSVIPTSGVWAIAPYAFSSFWEVKQLFIPDNITEIGRYAFGGAGLTSFTFPETVTVVPDYAFYKCSYLQSVTLSDLTTEIGENAFGGCNGLTTLTIPATVTKIGKAAFYSVFYLKDIYYEGTMADWEAIGADTDSWKVQAESMTIHCTDGDIDVRTYDDMKAESGS